MKRFKPYLIGAVVMLAILLSASVVMASPTQATGCFPDTNGHWAETFICWMEQYGIVGGYGDGTFRPENRITRAEVSVMMQNTASLTRAAGKHFYGCGFLCIGSAGAVAPASNMDFGQVTIDAPSAGYLLVNGSLELDCQGGIFLPGSCQSSYGDSHVVVNGSALYNRMPYNVDGGDHTLASTSMTQSHTAFIPITAGSHTVALRVGNSGSSAGPTEVWAGGINVLFVGFNGSGNTP